MSDTDNQQRVEEYLKKAGEDLAKHADLLNKTVFKYAGEFFEYIQNSMLKDFPEVSLTDANYIMTGVCVHVLAHFHAHGTTPEFARVNALENFNTWYKIAVESAIKGAEELKKNEKT